eukprot:8494684-Heterocapsa_arctica.AAC.1
MRKAAVHPRVITEDELSSENAARGAMLYSLLVALGWKGAGHCPEGAGRTWARSVETIDT